MGDFLLPDLQCRSCGHYGNDYNIRPTANGLHQTCFCGQCGSYIKNLSKEDKYGTKEQQAAIWGRTNGRCAYCGDSLNPFEKTGLTYDHIEPQAFGGGHETENLFCCCKSCNSQKGKKTVEQYREYLMQKNIRPKWVFYFEVVEFSNLGDILSKMYF